MTTFEQLGRGTVKQAEQGGPPWPGSCSDRLDWCAKLTGAVTTNLCRVSPCIDSPPLAAALLVTLADDNAD